MVNLFCSYAAMRKVLSLKSCSQPFKNPEILYALPEINRGNSEPEKKRRYLQGNGVQAVIACIEGYLYFTGL
jgi:hypothetical protein